MNEWGEIQLAEKIIKIGIAGCGWIAEKAHIPAFKSIEGVEVVSVYDLMPERALEVAGRNGIGNVFEDFDRFLESGIDAVIIATPNDTHAGYTIKALEHGKHVLCEKPVALYARDVSLAMEAARKADKLFIPGFVNRFREDIQKVAALVRENEIGPIHRINAGWVRRAGMPRPGTWFTNKKLSGGGVLLDLGSHVMDICLMFLRDQTPEQLDLYTWRNYGRTTEASASWFETGAGNQLPVDVEDTALAKIQFRGGTTLEVELSWCAPVDNDYTYFTISGARGTIQLRTLFGFGTGRLWEDDSLVVNHSGADRISLPLDRTTNNTGRAFYEMAGYFIQCIQGKKPDYLAMEDGLRVVRVTETLYGGEKKPTSDLRSMTVGCEVIG